MINQKRAYKVTEHLYKATGRRFFESIDSKSAKDETKFWKMVSLKKSDQMVWNLWMFLSRKRYKILIVKK